MTFEEEIKAEAILVFEGIKERFGATEQPYLKLALWRLCVAVYNSLEQRTLR
jgi:hypothetical protein